MNVEKLIDVLKEKGYDVSFWQTPEEAAIYLTKIINNKTVGFGDSATLTDLKMYERLSESNKVFDPQNCEKGMSFQSTAIKCLTTEIYLTSVNALAETGELVNIDGTGNRVAGSLFGHQKVFFVLGINKVAPTLKDAICRARNIAAPKNARRLGLKTPCAEKGDRCYDCSSPDRICNGIVLHLKKMNDIDMEVVLINDSIGY